MFYSAKNAKVKINERQFICSEVQLEAQAQVQPNFYHGAAVSTNYSAVGGIAGSLRLSYYLTGTDPIKPYLDREMFMTGEICGIGFNSGRLRTFGFNASPNSPVQINAEITFFDKITGTFLAQSVTNENYPLLNFSNATVSTLTSYSQETISNITNLNYNYSAEIEPIFTIGSNIQNSNLLPERVRVNRKQIVTDLVCDTLTTKLALTGENAGLSIAIKHPTQNIRETYVCSGKLITKNFNTSIGQPFKTNYSIIQHTAGNPPAIESFTGTPSNDGNIYALSPLLITGTNFHNLLSVYVGKYQATVTGATENAIYTYVPSNAVTDYITVNTVNGFDRSLSQLVVTQVVHQLEPPRNSSLTRHSNRPQYALPGSEIIYHITGTDFYDIQYVKFGDYYANFETISPTVIRARIPTSGRTGPIVVSGRSMSGSTTGNYIYPINITGYGPVTGIYGDTIIISGENLDTTSVVKFNNILTSFTISSPFKLNVTLPSGNTRGPIFVSGTGSDYTLTNFDPKSIVTSISPTSGVAATLVSINGKNFDTGIMYNITGNQYLVKFNGINASFTRVSDVLLTGLSPTGYTTGPVTLINNSGQSSSTASGYFVGLILPLVSGVTPSVAYSGKIGSLTLNGKYFLNPSAIYLSGASPNNLNQTILFSTFRTDILGIKSILSGQRFTGVQTGLYQVGLINNVGTGLLSGISGNITTGVTGLFRILPPRNIALQGIATQSGVYTGDGTGLYSAYFGIDGFTSGTVANKRLAWTATGTNPFWQVDLRNQYEIQEIKVYNRMDSAGGVSSPLTNFSLTIYTGDGIGSVYTTTYSNPEVSTLSFLTSNVTGRYIKVVLNGSNKCLAMSEVEVY